MTTPLKIEVEAKETYISGMVNMRSYFKDYLGMGHIV